MHRAATAGAVNAAGEVAAAVAENAGIGEVSARIGANVQSVPRAVASAMGAVVNALNAMAHAARRAVTRDPTTAAVAAVTGATSAANATSAATTPLRRRSHAPKDAAPMPTAGAGRARRARLGLRAMPSRRWHRPVSSTPSRWAMALSKRAKVNAKAVGVVAVAAVVDATKAGSSRLSAPAARSTWWCRAKKRVR